ncbi:hypothetical protein FRC0024_02423 [Corynebacterium diphtheriae]|nr:hypothetical protein FRC0024_02423 [Corynebacterium diphtheriae]
MKSPRMSDDLTLKEFLVTGAVAFVVLAVVLALLPNDEGDGGLPFARDGRRKHFGGEGSGRGPGDVRGHRRKR